MNIRNLAFKILLSVERDSAYSALALNHCIKENKLNPVDSSFLSALVYGCIERQITLDYIIQQYSKIPLKKIDLKTKLILRLGILQLLFMDKVPDSAAVNESVKLAHKNKLSRSTGFINGILRSITRAELKYTLPNEKNRVERLSVKYSCPEEIVRLWSESYGEEITREILSSLSGRPQLTARVNTLKTNTSQLINELEALGVKAMQSRLDKNAVTLSNTGSVESLKPFKEGKLYIQDMASQLCVKALSPKPGEVMLDVCSAPGGKSFTAAQYMNDRGRIYAFDIYEHKLGLIRDTAKRLGINSIRTALRDASDEKSESDFAEKVLCDVPCSGLGILSRKPEIRYKKDILDNTLPELQYKILCNNARFVMTGGTLVYSTCTLNPNENNKNAERFLREHKSFEPLALDLGVKSKINEPDNMLTLFPSSGETDGFFIAAFRRVSAD